MTTRPGNRRPVTLENRLPLPLPAILLVGMLLAQGIATAHVHRSNLEVHETAEVLLENGYRSVPNVHVTPTLKTLGSAFYGGLFFTLSLGLFLSAFSMICAWIHVRLLGRRRRFLLPFAVLWLWGIVSANLNGVAPFATAYFLLIPPAVFILSLARLRGGPDPRTGMVLAAHAAVLILLALLARDHFRSDTFSLIRDEFLLTHPAGVKVNDFYYRYTLYAASAFKSLEQKIVRTSHIDLPENPGLERRLERTLARRDYLPVDTPEAANLVILKVNQDLALLAGDRTVSRVAPKELLTRTKEHLTEFSEKTDRHNFLRQSTFIAILGSFGGLLYLLILAPIRLIAKVFPKRLPAELAAAGACLVVGGLLLWRIGAPEAAMDAVSVNQALASGDTAARIEALKAVERNRWDITSFPGHRKLLTSGSIVERFRMARVLGLSHDPEAFHELRFLLEDPYFTVVYSALFSLGRRGERRAVPAVLSVLDRSDHWYVQLYAYRALRRLGWTQSASR